MKTISQIVLVLGATSGAFFGGFSLRDLWAHRPPSIEAINSLFRGNNGQLPPTALFQKNFDRITTVAGVSPDPDRLKYASMTGMFASLGDPHTNFLEPVDADLLKLETRGDFVGIGARLASDPAGAKIATVFSGSPAEAAGVLPGDTIIEVDGGSTAGLPTDDIVKRVRGIAGTIVKIKIVRSGRDKPLVFAIKRATVVLPSAEGRMLPGTKVAYIAISGFAQPTVSQLDLAIENLQAHHPTGYVLDLRGNPGGLLDSAVAMLGRFVEGRPAVTTKRRGGLEEHLLSPVGMSKHLKVPIVILINEDSASAAEIFSGVMQEYKQLTNTTLLGEHSYGKSSVQNVIPLVDFSSAKVTIAKYFLPSGRDIGRKVDEDGEYLSGGLRPDIVVPVDESGEFIFADPVKDNQLKKAIEVIESKRG